MNGIQIRAGLPFLALGEPYIQHVSHSCHLAGPIGTRRRPSPTGYTVASSPWKKRSGEMIPTPSQSLNGVSPTQYSTHIASFLFLFFILLRLALWWHPVSASLVKITMLAPQDVVLSDPDRRSNACCSSGVGGECSRGFSGRHAVRHQKVRVAQ